MQVNPKVRLNDLALRQVFESAVVGSSCGSSQAVDIKAHLLIRLNILSHFIDTLLEFIRIFRRFFHDSGHQVTGWITTLKTD